MVVFKPDQAKAFIDNHIIVILILIFALGVGSILYHVHLVQTTLVEVMAMSGAHTYARTMDEFRQFYSAEIVDSVKMHGIEITHDYDTKDKAIPIPATLSILLGQRLTAQVDMGDVRVYSAYPFPWRRAEGGPRDAFETEALHTLERFPDQPFYRFEDYLGKPTIRLATAVVMEQSCIDCHNRHPHSPKVGWRVGDVRGATEIIMPLNRVRAQAQSGLRRTFMLLVGLSFLGCSTLGLVIHQIRRRTTALSQRTVELEHEVRERQRVERELRQHQNHLEELVAQRTQTLSHTLTNLENAQEALTEAKELAETANQAKSRFLAHMSHELRTPLNVIIGFAQLMRRDADATPDQHEHLRAISTSGDHLLALINDVLEMSKIEAGRLHLNETDFDVYRLLDDLQRMFRLQAEEKFLDLCIELAPEVPQYLRADRGKLQQVFTNLLNNAIKFTDAGRVTLRVSPGVPPDTADALALHVEVEDTGPGMPAQALETIFDPFVQTEGSHKGTGLGLAICQQFVTLMGGQITVASTLGQGTCFAFDLPVQPGAIVDEQPSREEVIGLASGQPTYRILVVEDQPESRQFLVKLLQSVGFDVREASDGRAALEILTAWQPHLVWMDLHLPLINGYETTRRLKAHPGGETAIVIALTASSNFEREHERALAAGCDDFVYKPVPAAMIFDKLAFHLGVRYRYREPAPEAIDTSSQPSLETLHVIFADMPRAWIDKLRQAALSADAEWIRSLCADLAGEQAALRVALLQYVQHYRFDTIQELTQQVFDEQ